MGAVFGTLCSLAIGVSDLFTRRVVLASGALITALAVSVVAIATTVVAVVAFGSSMEPRDFALGLVSGLGLGIGLYAYYGGLARSSATVVTPPVAVLAAVIPYIYAVADGANAPAGSILGAGIAGGGLVLVTIGGGGAHHVRAGLIWGLASGVAYGLGFAVVIEASSSAGALPALGQRVAATILLIGLAVRTGAPPVPPRHVRWSAIIGGVFAGAALVFFIAGLRADATAAVITGSMFPAASVAIGRLVYGDSVSRVQLAGLIVVLVGIALVVSA